MWAQIQDSFASRWHLFFCLALSVLEVTIYQEVVELSKYVMLAIWIPSSSRLMAPSWQLEKLRGLKALTLGTQRAIDPGSLLQLLAFRCYITCLRVQDILLRHVHRTLYRILSTFHFCSSFLHRESKLSHDICIISKAVEITSPRPSDTIHQPRGMRNTNWPLRLVIHCCSFLWNSWVFSRVSVRKDLQRSLSPTVSYSFCFSLFLLKVILLPSLFISFHPSYLRRADLLESLGNKSFPGHFVNFLT